MDMTIINDTNRFFFDLDNVFIEELLPALQRLDQRLERALQQAQTAAGAEASADLYRGLYIDEAEVARLLQQAPGAPIFGRNGAGHSADWVEAELAGSRLGWLQQRYDLSGFDLDLVLLALAPELDRRYERLYAYLQNHVNRRWPSVDLALHLFCANAVERLQRRSHFDPDAPLVMHGLMHLLAETEPPNHSLLAQTLKLDEQVVRFLLHQDGLDARLVRCCQLVTQPTDRAQTQPLGQTLATLLEQAHEEARPLRLYLQGPDGVGKRQLALAAASVGGLALLLVDLPQAVEAKADLAEILRLVFRYATFYGAIPYLEGVDALVNEQKRLPHLLLEALSRHAGVTLLAGAQPWLPSEQAPGVLVIPLALPDFAQRRTLWQQQLEHLGYQLPADDLTALADRFRLATAQITEAAVTAHELWRWQAASATVDTAPDSPDFYRAARAQSGHELAALARKIEPTYRWADLILAEDALSQLRELCQRVVQRQQVLGAWGFAGKLALGKGVNALFAGPSGAGKTMAAEIIAHELALDLYKIDLSGVVSKYIGETEKNLNRLFAAAESANAILFFDEADALFGKRSEVSDSHDRYANIEISYLLQKMEEYDGVAILATNLRQNLDDAFVRRLAFAIHFPFPDETSRLRIWQGVWPAATPLAADVDLAWLARQFKLAGGNIKNIALAAAFLAASDSSPVTMRHLIQATRREHQKLGKPLNPSELGPYAQEVAP